ncbi:hypothetical protein EVAR_13679_1 [Eumeta japonica]|uniref:Uncharacterized protein n=1 Tax=Eumeta variegata TaxID=151549 RepID=A0A4C1UCR9_EUMVA|nr:hypothetical protein EVAR_13679_1 [Eumeta japonica]
MNLKFSKPPSRAANSPPAPVGCERSSSRGARARAPAPGRDLDPEKAHPFAHAHLVAMATAENCIRHKAGNHRRAFAKLGDDCVILSGTWRKVDHYSIYRPFSSTQNELFGWALAFQEFGVRRHHSGKPISDDVIERRRGDACRKGTEVPRALSQIISKCSRARPGSLQSIDVSNAFG